VATYSIAPARSFPTTWSTAKIVAAFVSLLVGLAACTGNAPIPSGAQQVRISVTGSDVELQPDSVPAGDVYLVLDDGAVTFIERKAGPDATAGPLTEGQIAQVQDGNLQDTSSSGLEATNCDADQREAARNMTGPCGNVMLVQVRPGRYLIMAGAPEESGAPAAVLTVTP
jgi:hypothetical protein